MWLSHTSASPGQPQKRPDLGRALHPQRRDQITTVMRSTSPINCLLLCIHHRECAAACHCTNTEPPALLILTQSLARWVPQPHHSPAGVVGTPVPSGHRCHGDAVPQGVCDAVPPWPHRRWQELILQPHRALLQHQCTQNNTSTATWVPLAPARPRCPGEGGCLCAHP